MTARERRHAMIMHGDIEIIAIIKTRSTFGKWKKRKWEIYENGVAKVWSCEGVDLKKIINLKNTKIVDNRKLENNLKVELKNPLYLQYSSTNDDKKWAEILLKHSIPACSPRIKLAQYTDPVILSDEDGVIISVNAQFETLTGYKVEDAIGKTVSMILGKDVGSFQEEYTLSPERRGNSKPRVFESAKQDGTKLNVMVNLSIYYDGDKMRFITSLFPLSSYSALRRNSSNDPEEDGIFVEDGVDRIKVLSTLTPIFMLIMSDTLTVKNASKYTADINTVIIYDREGQVIEEPPLLSLMNESNWPLAKKLIKLGADVNAVRKVSQLNRSTQRFTPLDILLDLPESNEEIEDMIKYVIDAGGDIRKVRSKSKIFVEDHTRPYLSLDYFVKTSVSLAISKRLEVLDLSKCNIKSLSSILPLPAVIALAPTLTKLDISKNRITKIPHSFGLFEKLVELDLTGNNIKLLPESIGSLKNLKELKIKGNPISYPPKAMLKQNLEQALRLLSEKYNRTSEFLNLKMMIFSENEKRSSKLLKLIEQSLVTFPRISLSSSWRRLTDLTHQMRFDQPSDSEVTSIKLEGKMKAEIYREYNRIKKINKPKKNNKIQAIPDKTSPSTLSPSDTEPTNFPEYIRQLKEEKAKYLMNHIKSKLLDPDEGLFSFINKTHSHNGTFYGVELLAWLASFDLTVEERIEISQELIYRDIIHPITENCSNERFSDKINYTFTQEIDVKVTINCRSFSLDESINRFNYLFTSRTVYLIEFDLSTYYKENKLEFWLQSIYSRSQSNSSIIIVGTNSGDISSAEAQRILGEINVKFSDTFSTVKCITSFNFKSKNASHITDLIRAEAFEILDNSPTISNSFTMLYDIISEMKEQDPPVLALTELQWIARQISIDQDQLNQFLRYFNDSGLLITFPETTSITSGLSEYVIIDPKWVSNIINFLLENHLDFNFGIAERKIIQKLWEQKEFPPKFQEFLFPFFESVEIILPVHNTNYFIVPFLLPDSEHFLNFQNYIEDDIFWVVKKTGLFKVRECSVNIYRLFHLEYIPPGIMSRLTKRLLEIYSAPKEVNLYLSLNCIIISQPTKFQLILAQNEDQRLFSIRLRCFEFDDALIQYAMAVFENAIEYWITLIRYYYHLEFRQWIPCSECIKRNPAIEILNHNPCEPHPTISYFNIEHCTFVEKELHCKVCSSSITVSELDYDLANHQIQIIQFDDKLGSTMGIGEGSFAHVKQIELKVEREKKDHFAAKVFTKTSSECLNEIRREIMILKKLHTHPNIISMMGISIEPLALVMEVAPVGDLYAFLHQGNFPELSWSNRVKIALDIANGLLHMHTSKPVFVHRDLKSPNVLLFEEENCLTAKITDFGCSLILSGDGIKEIKNERDVQVPTWLAPEVILGDIYTEKADIYAFGIILYELLTRKHPYKNMVRKDFNYLIEELIISGIRPDVPPIDHSIDYIHRFSTLMESCWSHYPHNRPNIQSIVDTLQSIQSSLML